MNALLVVLSFAAAVDVPPELEPWRAWLLHGSERGVCPVRLDGTKVCEAPAKLELVVDKTGGTFAQSWRIFAKGLVPLPGDATHWPLDVEVDGKPAIVVGRGGGPTVLVDVGEHTVRGRFA